METLLYSKSAVVRQYGYYERPAFSPPRLEKGTGSEIPWTTFKSRMSPFLTVPVPNPESSGCEIIFTTKDVAWSTRDANMWIGSDSRKIEEIDDLTQEEGVFFFDTGLSLAKKLAENTGLGHTFAIGFNPKDIGTPGHHNVSRLHSHLRCYEFPDDVKSIEPKTWKEMSWYNRLTFIEPFAPIFYDFFRYYFSTRQSQAINADNTTFTNNIIAAQIPQGMEKNIFAEIQSFYAAAKTAHSLVFDIFTDGTIDPNTKRPIPRQKDEIKPRLEGFLSENNHIFSVDSQNILRHLALHIVPAEKRPENRDNFIEKPSHVFIDKGFSGAINIAYQPELCNFRLEFIPRVISSSSVAKTMFGYDAPTLMGAHVPANENHRAEVQRYIQSIHENLLG
jgi:hypothetical protein